MPKALVTGAAKRLGRAIALDLAETGHDVAIHYHTSSEAAEEVANAVRLTGQAAVLLQADLAQEDQVAQLVPRAVLGLGGALSLLVNNASVFEEDSAATATRASWDRHMEANLRAPFVLTQAFAAQVADPVPDDRGEPVAQGLVVNLLDQRMRKLTPDFLSYTLSKAGLTTLTHTLAQGLAPRVRVNGIGPGPTLRNHRQTEAQFAAQRAATILERGANPEDVTAALRYLLAAPGVTGQMIVTDGGQHLAWRTADVEGLE